MTVQLRPVDYAHEDTPLRGFLAWDDAWDGPRPGVLVVHDGMKSRAGFEKTRAESLARMGYAGFAVDVYGRDVHGSSVDEARMLMQPFQDDRRFLLRRLLAGLEVACRQPAVDAQRMAAIGYCFGGLCVLDLARGGAPVHGVVSFHGLLSPPPATSATETPPSIDARVLVLHGWDDPFAPPEQIAPFAAEMTRAGADWQLMAFGRTAHGFTNPTARMPEEGIAYNERSDRRSWHALEGFLEELLPVD